MALQKQIVSMNLGRGMDTSTDEKVGPGTEFSNLQDFVYPKLKRLDKRPGTNKLPTTIQTNFPNPLSIGTSALKTTCFANRDELLLQNKGALYSYFQSQSKWEFKGHYNPIEVNTFPVASNQFNLSCPDSATVNGIAVTAYLATNPSTTVYTVKFCAQELSTGAYIANDITIEDVTFSGSPFLIIEPYIRVVAFSGAVFITYVNGANLRIVQVNLADGSLGTITSLQTDVMAPTSSNQYAPDFTLTSKVGVGERIFCAYYASAGTVKVFALTSSGVIDTSIGTYSVAETVVRGMSIVYNATADRLFMSFQTNTFQIISTNLSFTASGITLGLRQTVQTLSALVTAITQTQSPFTPAQNYLFYDENGGTFAPESKIYKAVVSGSAIIAAASLVGQSLNLFGKAITDSIRTTIYLPCFYASQNQGTLFLIDVLKGKIETGHYTAAKWLFSLLSINPSTKLQQVTATTSTKLQFAQTYKTRIIAGSSVAEIAPIFQTGISLSQIDLTPARAASNAYLAGATHLTGGYLGYYDGSTFCESGFFLNPETADISSSNGTARIAVQITPGTPSTQEVTLVICQSGPLQLPGPAYWTFNTTTAPYYVWYKINGVGTDPAVGGKIGIRVDLTGTETAAEVQVKNVDAINAALPTALVQPISLTIPTTTFRITNNLNGDVPDATVSNYTFSGSLEAGTYQYSFVWAWVDVNGQVVRSAPSVPQSVTVGLANSTVGIAIHVPPITNRTISQCRVEVYRTLKNTASNFYKITNSNQEALWSSTSARVFVIDNRPDSSLTGNEPLYTTGNVFENFQIPACKNLSTFKNRILASGVDDNTIYYSKSAQNGAPIEFTQEGILRFDNSNDPITAHIQLDDKLLVFKKNAIIYVAGDGINDVGGGGSFTQPITLPFAVGTEDQNSVITCPLGVIFKSKKGFYLIDRGVQVSYIGLAVKAFNQYTVSSAKLLTDDNEITQIRFNLSDSPMSLVFDYSTRMWSVFSNYGGTDACIWQESYVRVDGGGGCYVEDKTIFTDVGSTVASYSPTFTTQWIQAKDVQDYARVYRLAILGELKSAHTLNYQIYYDYDETNFDTYSFASTAITGFQPGDSVYQPIIHLKRQKCEAMKIKITAVPIGGTEQSLTLTDMSFEVGLKQGMMKVKAGKKL